VGAPSTGWSSSRRWACRPSRETRCGSSGSPSSSASTSRSRSRTGFSYPPATTATPAWIAEIETAERRRWVAELEARWGGFYDGDLTRLEARLALKPSPHLLLSAEGEWSRGELPTGRFTAKVLAGRLEVNFTPNLGWSNLVQYDSDSRELGFQSRLRWRVRPGSDVFVVFNRGWVHQEDGVFRPYFDRGSAKVQHTFRW
jgi:hypothetical protein